MTICYKKLWKLLIDKDIRKKKLREMAGISPSTIAKLGRMENVNTDVLLRICRALKCDLSDIMEILPNEENKCKNDFDAIDISQN